MSQQEGARRGVSGGATVLGLPPQPPHCTLKAHVVRCILRVGSQRVFIVRGYLFEENSLKQISRGL